MDDGTRINIILGCMGGSVFVLFCLIIACARHCRDRADDDLYGYNIDMIDGRDLLLRENLVDTVLEDGKTEWQCVVCMHMNHPDQATCALCGASADASLLNGSMLLSGGSLTTTVLRNNNNNNTTFLTNETAFLHSATGDIPLLRSSSSATNAAADSIELTTSVRQRALRYRRLNQMQLTQKQRGAARRRLWQRVSLPNGAFVWVRTTQPTLQKSDSFLSKLRNNTFLTKNPHANALRGTVAEQLRRKNAATMGFFTEMNDDGELAWRKTDSVAIQMDPARDTTATGAGVMVETGDKTVPQGAADVDFEGLMSMSFREKKKWFLKQVSSIHVPYMESVHKLMVRRDHILEDSVLALGGYLTPKQLREHLNITFIGEPALDAGGVLREWFGLVCKELFSAERGLFCTTHAENMSYWINPSLSRKRAAQGNDGDGDYLKYYTFAGRLFGKAMLEGLVFDANMALPLLKHFLSVPITFSDLEFLDEEVYKSAVWMRENDNVDSLCLTFSVQGDGDDIIELKPNGNDIDVTDENKMEYLALMLRYRMLGSVAEPLTAMLAGLYEIIPKSMLCVFDYQELDFFLSGLPMINVKDWQLNTRVLNFARDSDIPAIEREIQVVFWFWEVVESFTDEERARLLQFATGSARVPVEGFKALTSASGYVHQFCIQFVAPGVPPLGMCPRAHTCFNRIDLPVYETKEDLVTYLTLVIQMEITGFGFE
uniref:HECT-type E3 ubiquitin transferase n=1 Tax=Globisporangium ultimum (strain ATCC 200006 / CBS 805.95 / DAOM BR144) TaxID=431595 RepID=K3WHW1_GLOUD